MFRLITVQEPRISFYLGEDWNPRRIIKLKPFTYMALKDQEIVLKVLTDVETEKLTVKMVNKLINGYRGSYYFYPPFIDVYGMQIRFDEKEGVTHIDEGSAFSKLEEVADSIIETNSPGIIMLSTRGLPSSVYRRVKLRIIARYSKKNLRTQFVNKQRINDLMDKSGFEFFLLNLATAIYAKAGGTPWKLSRSLVETRGLIIGISFARRKEERGDEVIYYGAVELLDRYGEHLFTRMKMFIGSRRKVETKGLYVPYENMVDLLENAIKQYGAPPLLIIHKSSPFVEDEEIKAINDVLGKYSGRGIQIALIAVHVKRNVIYRLFDTDAKDYSPARGYLLVDEGGSAIHRGIILFTTGRLQGEDSRKKLGTPKPIELDVIANTMGKTKPEWLAKQVLGLTKLDWNTTEPEIRIPITIKYSNKAAKLASYILAQELPDLLIGDIRDLM